MNKKQALAKLRKLLGPRAMYEIRERAPSADERFAIRAALREKVPERNAAKEAMDARRRELLQDPEYRQMVERYQALASEVDRMTSITHSYRISVGKNLGLCFEIAAQGDTWGDVFEKLEAKNRKT